MDLEARISTITATHYNSETILQIHYHPSDP